MYRKYSRYSTKQLRNSFQISFVFLSPPAKSRIDHEAIFSTVIREINSNERERNFQIALFPSLFNEQCNDIYKFIRQEKKINFVFKHTQKGLKSDKVRAALGRVKISPAGAKIIFKPILKFFIIFEPILQFSIPIKNLKKFSDKNFKPRSVEIFQIWNLDFHLSQEFENGGIIPPSPPPPRLLAWR